MRAKSLFASRTIWFNVLTAGTWLLGLAVDAAQSGAVPEEWSSWAAAIAFVGNAALRFVTREPIENPFS